MAESLVGAEATGAVGTAASLFSKAATGVEATGAVGTVISAPSPTLTKNTATGAVGTIVPSTTFVQLLTGNSTTGVVGVVVPVSGFSAELVGNSGTGATGVFTSQIVAHVYGVDATSTAGAVAALGWIPVDISQPAIWAPEMPIPDTRIPVSKAGSAWTPVAH